MQAEISLLNHLTSNHARNLNNPCSTQYTYLNSRQHSVFKLQECYAKADILLT